MILKNLQRLYISSCAKAMNYSTVREARYLSKIISKGQCKKRSQNNQFPSRSSSISYIKDTLSKKNIIRMSALNKTFMRHITEILETSDCADELNKYGIEITKVLITSDYNFMNVFWINTKKMDESKINQILFKTAGLLRYELSVLKIVGHIPEIQFLKDVEQLRNDELDRIFNELNNFSKEYNEFNVKKINDTEANMQHFRLSKNKSFNELPVMSQNIFGLDHSNILKKILLKKTQSGAEKFRHSKLLSVEDTNCSQQDTNSSNVWQFDKKLLSKIIFKNKYLQKKMLRKEKKAAPFVYDLKEHYSNEESDIEDGEHENESEEYKDV